MGLKKAINLGIKSLLTFCAAATVVNSLKEDGTVDWNVLHIQEEVRSKLTFFDSVYVTHISRNANAVAHTLACQACKYNVNSFKDG
uniref:RNase H type-1 domain-containing protein n=1 Tax=Nelumbo nucifera TaxID=4432 RepID=A0A822Y6P7_NELNU|nr:TPA_asm: hypothetical protein HUJ06_029648 [Nelumbo nucifera]